MECIVGFQFVYYLCFIDKLIKREKNEPFEEFFYKVKKPDLINFVNFNVTYFNCIVIRYVLFVLIIFFSFIKIKSMCYTLFCMSHHYYHFVCIHFTWRHYLKNSTNNVCKLSLKLTLFRKKYYSTDWQTEMPSSANLLKQHL